MSQSEIEEQLMRMVKPLMIDAPIGTKIAAEIEYRIGQREMTRRIEITVSSKSEVEAL